MTSNNIEIAIAPAGSIKLITKQSKSNSRKFDHSMGMNNDVVCTHSKPDSLVFSKVIL